MKTVRKFNEISGINGINIAFNDTNYYIFWSPKI